MVGATTSSAPLSRKIPLAPHYQAIFEKYFDPEDGFTAEIEDALLTITVPQKFSNATDAHLKFYKKDTRDKVMDMRNLEASLESYCKLVARNLNYNKILKTK